MEILAWNCRGLNNPVAVQALKLLIQQRKPSFIFLSETKIDDWEYMNSLRLQIGYLNCEAVFSEGQSGGVVLFWADGLDVRFRSKSRSHVDVEVRETDGSGVVWRLTGLYGNPATADRHLNWALLRSLWAESALPWVVVGDMNELLHAYEKEGGVVRRERQMQPFRDALSQCDLFDLGFHGSPFTWRGPGMRSRLDRAVASVTWSDIFPAARVLHLSPVHGDHVPILVGAFAGIPPTMGRRRHRFRFESFWTFHEGCRNVVKAGWEPEVNGLPMQQVTRKIMHTRFSLNRWQRESFGMRRREIELLRDRLQALFSLPLSAANQEECSALNAKLEGLLAEEDAYWKQRSKVTWIHLKEWRMWCCTISPVCLNLMILINSTHMQNVVGLLQPKVTDDMNFDLCAPCSALEIRAALFQMYPTKAPGPDGMPPMFFQKYWEVVGGDVVSAVQNFLHTRQILGEINFTHICLIPKEKDPVSVTDLRPIALCNVIYKICSKVIANRLKKILSKIISPFQSAFIPGRLITDNTLVANDVSHFIHNCYSSTEGVFSLKLDMSKAYDRMEWSFLEVVFLSLGFAESWLGVIMKCVTTVKYAFLINDQHRGHLTPTRGLRQGDPLSPYLFLLCTEVFSALLERKVGNGELQGIKVCEGAPTIHHLLFADDSLLFGKATLHECLHIQNVLHDYELASGQQINFSKSSIVFSKRVPEVDKCAMTGFLGVSIEAKHEKYLGLPTYLGRNRTEPFAYIKENLSKKLAGWQGKLLSSAGKDLLIRVVAHALPSYAMSCFLLPKEFCDDLHQMCVRFWWGSKSNERKIHWMSWERLCRSKEEGGMGFRDLHAHNLALLAKQGWRLLRNPGTLVSRLFKARYFPGSSFLEAPAPNHASACWRGIFAASSVLRGGIRWQKGLFSTKSTYKVAFASLHPAISDHSSSMVIPSSWKHLWAASVPGKVKVHVWKVCASILPTTCQLRERRVPVGEGCLFCNREEETISHVSRECIFVRDVVGLAPDLGSVLGLPPCSLLEWLALCYTVVSPSSFSLLMMLLWGVWKERNQHLWYGKFCSAHQVYFQVVTLFHSFKVARIPEKVKLGCQVKPWCPPSAGWLKANIDGAFDMITRSGGLGVVIRDSVGTVVAGACGTCTDVASPVVVEALACRLACKVVVDNDLGPVMFEADCLQVVQAICAEGEDTSDFGRIIDDISSLLFSLAGSFFSHVYRESNKLAHKVAKYALLSGAQVSWSGHVPPGLDGLFQLFAKKHIRELTIFT
ncbi:uncharacterized protein LOC133744595 [Rosa rugosa]|uniref:uncharacterized protein LOC133744595 n=1 Tax=Rosa rugosa TaxID=74645 RepID=UPI002B409181|nr:uncharacterized protein LOC133744595 [Rosa rugosa]